MVRFALPEVATCQEHSRGRAPPPAESRAVLEFQVMRHARVVLRRDLLSVTHVYA